LNISPRKLHHKLRLKFQKRELEEKSQEAAEGWDTGLEKGKQILLLKLSPSEAKKREN